MSANFGRGRSFFLRGDQKVGEERQQGEDRQQVAACSMEKRQSHQSPGAGRAFRKDIKMRRSIERGIGLSCTTAMTAFCLVGTAHAQSQTQSTDGASDNANISGTEIVVTAQRRDERAQDVPISITAFSPERLQQQGITQAQKPAGRRPVARCRQ